MKVKLGRGQYQVSWIHENPPGKFLRRDDERLEFWGGPPAPVSTKCQVKLVGKRGRPGTVSEGIALLHPNDVFNADKGRRLSLRRALQNAGLSKPTRAKFWKAVLGVLGD